jgi:hypothetical protein
VLDLVERGALGGPSSSAGAPTDMRASVSWANGATDAFSNAASFVQCSLKMRLERRRRRGARLLARTLAPKRRRRGLASRAPRVLGVVDPDGSLVGVLTRGALIAGLAEHGPHFLVGSGKDRQFVTAHPSEMLQWRWTASWTARVAPSPCSPTTAGVVGMVTTDNIGELMMIRDTLRIAAHRRGPLELAA